MKKEENLQDSRLYEERFGKTETKSSFRFYAVLLALALLILGVRVYWTKTYGGVVVDGSSMRNTLTDGDKLLMRYVDRGAEPKRGDVIVVYVGDYEECGSVTSGFLIKRLIAVGGDKVYCREGQIYLAKNGGAYEPLEENYAVTYNGQQTAYNFGEYTVGEGEIFFLGDNRWNSCDSRYRELQGSHLKDRLYKASDIYGVVPEWAIEHKDLLEKIFFHDKKAA